VSGILKFPDFSLTLYVFPDFPWLPLTVRTLKVINCLRKKVHPPR